MNALTPTMIAPRRVAPDTEAFTAHYPIPGLGILPMNAFLIRASEPVLVDAGVVSMADDFLGAIAQAIDLEDLRWIWLTHTDPDHAGCLYPLLEAAPRATLVTSFLGMGKLGLRRPIPPERVFLLNPGQSLSVGDRSLLGLRPPVYDAPETTAAFDRRTGVLFSADSFGALLREPVLDASEPSRSALEEGMVTWATVDAPWLGKVNAASFERVLEELAALSPATVLGAHLPPAADMLEILNGHLRRALGAAPFMGPDQEALRSMMAGG